MRYQFRLKMVMTLFYKIVNCKVTFHLFVIKACNDLIEFEFRQSETKPN
jgi:hypothetical protein